MPLPNPSKWQAWISWPKPSGPCTRCVLGSAADVSPSDDCSPVPTAHPPSSSLPLAFSSLGKVSAECCYGDLTANSVLRIKFPLVEEDKAVVGGGLRQCPCQGYLSQPHLCTLYLRRPWKQWNGKPATKPEAKWERFWSAIQSPWAIYYEIKC